MTRQAFIRSLIAVVGLLAIVLGLYNVTDLVQVMSGSPGRLHGTAAGWVLVVSACVILGMLGMGVWLIIVPPRWLMRGVDEGQGTQQTSLTPAVVCNIALAVAGVVILSFAVSYIIHAVNMIILVIKDPPGLHMTGYAVTFTIIAVLDTGIGVYLLLGAPGLAQVILSRTPAQSQPYLQQQNLTQIPTAIPMSTDLGRQED